MIRHISHKTLGVALSLLMIGTVGGWAIVSKMAGDEAAFSFLIIGSWVQVVLSLLQLFIFFVMRKRIFLQLIFLASCGLSLVWFLFSMVSPVFWISAVDDKVKLLLLTVLVILSVTNILEAFRKFDKRWNGLDAEVRAKRLGMVGDTINWDKLIISMRLDVDLYIPGFSQSVSLSISILMLVFMIIGFILRHVFPLFSAFAWGIPSALIVAFLFQAIGFNLAQAGKVRTMEKEYKVIFRQKI